MIIHDCLTPGIVMRPGCCCKGGKCNPGNIVKSCPLEFWFDGQDASTISLNGNKVIQWDDKSGFDRHVSNAVDAQRPTYDPVTGRLTFNSAAQTYLQSAAFGADLNQPNTIFILYKIIGTLAPNETVFDAITTLNHLIGYWSSKFQLYAGIILSDGATNANDNIHTVEFNGATSNYWINGILVGGPGNVGALNLDGITLGNRGDFSQPADAEIMEVFGYNCLLTAGERAALNAYLTSKWGL